MLRSAFNSSSRPVFKISVLGLDQRGFNKKLLIHAPSALGRIQAGAPIPTAPLSPSFTSFVPRQWFERPEEFGDWATVALSPGNPEAIARAPQHPCKTLK